MYLCAIGFQEAAVSKLAGGFGGLFMSQTNEIDYQRVIGIAPTWCSKENYLKPKGET